MNPLRLLPLLLLLPGFAFAQSGKGKALTFGLKIGANFSELNTLEVKTPRLTGPGGVPVLSGGQVVYDFFQDNDSRTTGLVGGAFLRIGNFSSSPKCWFRPKAARSTSCKPASPPRKST